MTTTENTATASEVLEGEIVDGTEGPDASTGDAPAAEENASGAENANVPAPREEVETSELTAKQARSLADKIKKGLNGAADITDRMNKAVEDTSALMAEAYGKRIWLALDETSWEDFVSTELGDVRVRLERSVRQSLVYRMAEAAHMSTRAIAPVFGVDQKTVSNDLRQVRRELGVAPAPSLGLDGKEYTHGDAVTPRQRRAKPIEDRFNAAIEKADAAVGDLTALSVEEGWDEAVVSVRKVHKASIARLIDSLKGVQDRLQ